MVDRGGRISRRVRAGAAAAALAAGLALAGARPAGAVLLVYEPFAYSDATVLDGLVAATGQNLTGTFTPTLGNTTPQKIVVDSPGLGYGNLSGAPAPSGNLASQPVGTTAAEATVSVDQDVLVGPGETIFFSALFTFDDSSNGNRFAQITFRDDDTGDTLTFGEPVVGVSGIRISAATAATGGVVAAGADQAFTSPQTLLLIGRYVNGAGPGGDSAELIGYDTADAVALPSSFDPSDPNLQFAYSLSGLDIDFAKISSISFTIRGDANNHIDELRIGTNYGSVVPEPGAASLLLVGFAGLGAFARGRRTHRQER